MGILYFAFQKMTSTQTNENANEKSLTQYHGDGRRSGNGPVYCQVSSGGNAVCSVAVVSLISTHRQLT